MAEVFVARQRGQGNFLKPVAIKRMLPALAEEPKFVEMFLDEARLAALVQSPYVVSTLDCGKDMDGSPFIVMELVVGLSLSQAMRGVLERKESVPYGIATEIIAQTALGLYDAHNAKKPTGEHLGIVHRDVSPQNILVGVDGRARLTDFGVARALENVSRTSTGEVKGKLSYFSPEQARMEKIDHRSDIFALGIVAWECFAGERLFQRDNPMSALQAVLYENIPSIRDKRPDVPLKLARVIEKALARDLNQRFSSARDFAEALQEAAPRGEAKQIGDWIQEAGGARLETFQKRITSSFAKPAQPAFVPTNSGVQSSTEGSAEGFRPSIPPPSNSGSSASATPSLFNQGTPLLNVVQEAHTVPNADPDYIPVELASVVLQPPQHAANAGPSKLWMAGGAVAVLALVGAGVGTWMGTQDGPPITGTTLAAEPRSIETPPEPPALVEPPPEVPSVATDPVLPEAVEEPPVAQETPRGRGPRTRPVAPGGQETAPQEAAATPEVVTAEAPHEATPTPEAHPETPVTTGRLRVGTGSGNLRVRP
jgi:serine/threonine-protein kinase